MVISVLAVVTAISVYYYNDYVEDAKLVVRRTNEKLVNEAIARYYKEHMHYPKYEWKKDSLEDLGNKINRGLDSALSNYFVNKKVSEILLEGSSSKGYEVYFLVSEPIKRGVSANVDYSTATESWKMSKNFRVETKDFLVHKIIISDSGITTNTFNNQERFNFPLVIDSTPISNTSVGYNTIVPDEELDIKMVAIPAGSFVMGAPAGEKGKKNNENVHNVTLTKQYLISKYEITQKQYLTVMGNNPSQFTSSEFNPVERVTLDNAKAFCRKLNTNYSRLIPYGYEFDLPTEAQWEYACRAGTTTALNSGKDLSNGDGNACSNLNDVAWYKNNSSGKTHPVGLKKPNNWGLYDMHGNVEELLKDVRPSSYPPYPSEDAIDPLVTVGNQRCHRGGGFNTTSDRCRSASRQGSALGSTSNSVGFRVVLNKID